MIIINSNENKNFKLCNQLAQKKFRDKLGLYLIEGPNLLEEAVNSDVDIKLVVLNEEMLATLKIPLKEGSYKGTEVIGMSEKLFEKLAQTEASQGVIGVIKKRCETQEDVEKRILSKSENVIILDRLQDPGNIGTIIRTAEASGYKGVIVLKGTADVYSPKVIRAAAGSVFRLSLIHISEPTRLGMISYAVFCL